MKINIKRLGAAIILLMAVSCISVVNAQTDTDTPKPTHKTSDWEPIGVWPFVYKNFKVATVHTGIFKVTETKVPCNIHVGKSALWFSKDNETLMEAVPDNVRKIVFDDGDVYMPVSGANCFGKVLYEGELQGKTARVFLVMRVKQDAVDQMYLDHLNKTQNMLQGGGGAFFSHLADANNTEDPEKMPLPLENHFYYYFKGEVFEANTKNILAHIDPARKKEYRIYTRSAEIISTNESSMMKVWNDFFVKYKK